MCNKRNHNGKRAVSLYSYKLPLPRCAPGTTGARLCTTRILLLFFLTSVCSAIPALTPFLLATLHPSAGKEQISNPSLFCIWWEWRLWNVNEASTAPSASCFKLRKLQLAFPSSWVRWMGLCAAEIAGLRCQEKLESLFSG